MECTTKSNCIKCTIAHCASGNCHYYVWVYDIWFYSLTPYTWIRGYLKRADQNQDGKMSYDEVKHLLQMINIDLSEQYACSLFKVSVMCLYYYVLFLIMFMLS